MTDTVQTHEASTPAERQPPVVMEKSAQTDTTPHPQTTQAATQTGPPLRNYRTELKAKIVRNERIEQRQKEAIGQLREQAVSREAELKAELV